MKKTVCFALCTLLLLLPLASCKAKEALDAEGSFELFDGEAGYTNATSDVEQGAESPFVQTADNPVSTFGADVDTASYSYFRKLVKSGYSLSSLKATANGAIRTEEMVNYFRYDYKGPEDGHLFGVDAVISDCPWNRETKLMILGLQTETAAQRLPNNLVFLIDVSGSMASDDKLPLLMDAFSVLTDSLTEEDTVSIVTYSGRERVVLEGCPGNQGERILRAIRSLDADGSTNGEAGLQKAYALAEEYRKEGGNNRIIMASDGDLNVGISSAEELEKYVSEKRDEGVFLSVLGFGTGNYKDRRMETIADCGNGVYYYIDGEEEAEKVLGTDLLATLYTVGKDTKLQITFDESFVSSYRQIGYENRVMSAKDFADDTKDGGEVGAGHSLTVCYELILTDAAMEATSPWMTLSVRYKEPDGERSILNEYAIGAESVTAEPDEDYLFAANVVMTAMLLRDSRYLGDINLSDIIENVEALDSDRAERQSFLSLLQTLNAQKD